MLSKNFLIIGFGSIGKRHFSNIISLGYNNVWLVSSHTLLENRAVAVFKNIEEAFEFNTYDFVIICNKTSLHVDSLTFVLNQGVKNVYLEKPLGISLTGLNNFSSFDLNGVFVGFDLHFHPVLEKVQEILDAKIIGDLLSMNIFVGQDITQWRPNIDYRNSMSAKISDGGGVLFDLAHEFDYCCKIMGIPIAAVGLAQKNDFLQIQTEDIANVILKFQNRKSASIHLDYHQKKIQRFFILTGELGSIKVDFIQNNISLFTEKNEELISIIEIDRNERFVRSINSFINFNKDKRLRKFDDAIINLKTILAVKESMLKDKFISII
jgi:predicted dehydrogenase